MRRVVFKIGLVDVPELKAEPLGLIQASAEPAAGKTPREHWLTLSSTFKQLLGAAGVALALVGMRVGTKSDIAVLKDAHESSTHRADLQGEKIATLQAMVIPRDQYLSDWSRQNAINLQLATTQTQILLEHSSCRGGGN